MAAQPAARTGITVILAPDLRRGLDEAKRRIGVGPVDYIRQAVWQALVRDGFAMVPQPKGDEGEGDARD